MTDGGPAFARGDAAVVVRAATAPDAVSLAEIAAATFRLACDPDASDADISAYIESDLSVARFSGRVEAQDQHLFLAERGGAPLGFALLVDGPAQDADVLAVVPPRAAELSKLYVLPDAHGRGVAAPLMASCLSRAAALGATGVWLTVNHANVRAQRFYERSGFRRVGATRFRVGERVEDDDVFLRELP